MTKTCIDLSVALRSIIILYLYIEKYQIIGVVYYVYNWGHIKNSKCFY